MSHYIITGGAGFIGSNLTRHLFKTEPGIKITCIDNFDPFYPATIKHFNIHDFKDNPSYQLIETDLAKATDASLAAQIPEKVDAIIHLAAKAGVRPSIENPLSYQQANVIGLQNILDFAKLKGIKQFVFASSSSVYGINDHYPWKEEEKLMPISPYAMTKLAGEMLGHVYHKLFDMRFIALRFFTVFGPRQRPDLAIHKFARLMSRGDEIPVYGDGSTERDYTYVDDIVDGIVAALDWTVASDAGVFEVVNLGESRTTSLARLVEIIGLEMGVSPKIHRLPNQPGDVQRTFADVTKARELFGYDPATTVEEGIRRFADWFRAQPSS